MIRLARKEDISQLRQVFAESIRGTCLKDYNQQQIEAWLSKSLHNPERWSKLLANNMVYALTPNQQILGFASISQAGLIDMFYLHPQVQGRGLATVLYSRLENQARKLKLAELHSHVSITARPFFEKMGFEVQQEMSVEINDVSLGNFIMTKNLIISRSG